MNRSPVVAQEIGLSDRLALQAISGPDPKTSDDVCECYVSLPILKLPLRNIR